jgi:phospholipase/carboxylesterase
MNASSNSSEGYGLPLHHLVRRPAAGAIAGEGGSACLLLLHGVGSNETNLAGFAQAQDPRLTVILPRGPLAFGPNQHGWFNVNFTATGPVIDPAQAEASRNVLVSFIEGLPAAYGIAPGKVWIAGFSQGGIMSAGVGLTRPDKAAQRTSDPDGLSRIYRRA